MKPLSLSMRLKRRANRMVRQPVSWGLCAWATLLLAAGNHFLIEAHVAWTYVPLLLSMICLSMLGWAIGSAGNAGAFGDLLRQAIDVLPEARLITARDGSTVYANPGFKRLMPLMPGKVELAGIIDLLDGDHAIEEFKRLQANARNGIGDHTEIPIRLTNGSREWRRISVAPLGKPVGFSLWLMRDVSARREMETAQRKEFRQTFDFVDNLPIGFFSSDQQGRFRFVNQTLGDWLGVSPEMVRASGLGLSDFVVELKDGAKGAMSLKGADSKPFEVHVRQTELYDEQGQFVHNRCVVLREGIEFGSVATERPSQNSQKAALGFDPRVRWLFNEAPVGIAVLDLDRTVVDCNRAFLKMLGRHQDAIVGRPLFDQIKQDYHEDATRQLGKVAMGTIAAVRFDVQMQTAKGRMLTVSVFAGHMEDEAGQISGLVLHFIDATEQRDLELQFTQAQKMQAIGQLAGGVAHDFNNVLTALTGFCEILLERHPKGDPDHQELQQIYQSGNRATDLVRQLLAFSRKQTLRPKIVDISEVISDLSAMLNRSLGETVHLRIEHGRDLNQIRVDTGQLEQVVVNLAVNAGHAMNGEGEVIIRTLNAEINEAVEQAHDTMPPGQYVCVEVSDTGCGIAKENLTKIFEPFFTTKDVDKGTGLGLSTVYGIVRQTDGYIFVDSIIGQGTTFTIFFPAIEEDAEAPKEEKKAQPDLFDHADLTGTATILLVEDEDPVRLFGARALSAKGYEVLEASSGDLAWEIMKSEANNIDLIITDVVMPGMKGPDLIELVRTQVPDMKVIFMSGYAEDVIPEGIENDPTIHFLPKPFKLKDLAYKVKEVLGEI
ncbi:Signal transduction histidine kinase [Candidatus Terasakiella magnetica]|uniref:histidine kinase n=1 Tax=Candidatus Terasakiella magnetica TaxID=1867952 RepID=A0A1C3RKV8_9PROT|nr:PAS domain-containing sensor histidine kinase [Candidatus Terasakiella magnetica]SCA57907.1 Signal transduction histidine kinase [Candidatus Terasakiella magnetica]